jgi:carboxyl-terminal processing protease
MSTKHDAMCGALRDSAPLVLVWVVIFLGFDSSAHAQASASPYPRLEVFARALSHIENSYVGQADPDALIEGAIRGMLKVLDPHSSYLDRTELHQLMDDTQGRFGGVGVEIDVRDGWLTVLRVIPGGPAERAGVMAGDRFLTIEGESARDLPIDDAIVRMRGAPGTHVRVALRRAGVESAVDVTLTRAVIDVAAVEGRLLEDGCVYVSLRAFQQNTVDELRAVLDTAVERAGKRGVRGVLLDLRDNPGGLLSAAVLVADEFLSDGVIVSTRSRGGKLLRENTASRAGTRPAWPMVALVNGYSASSSEIVAGALQDHRRAVIAGTRTFGKGSVQNVIDLPDGSALKLTTALYYTPSGASIQARGIVPDVLIEQLDAATLEQARRGQASTSEADLSGHLVVQPKGSAALDTKAGASSDYQGTMALQVLRALVAQAAAR